MTELWLAARTGDVNTLIKELDGGADIEYKDHLTGHTALWEAVQKGHVDVVRELLRRGANPNRPQGEATLEDLTDDASIMAMIEDARTGKFVVDKFGAEDNEPSTPSSYVGDLYQEPLKHDSIGEVSPMSQAPMYSVPPLIPAFYPPFPPQQHIPSRSNPNRAHNRPCRFFAKGTCKYGDQCRFSHEFAKPMMMAQPPAYPYYPTPYAQPFYYPVRPYLQRNSIPAFPSMMPAPYPRARQHSQTQVCKFWLQGNCKYDSNCRFAHVLDPMTAATLRVASPSMRQNGRSYSEMDGANGHVTSDTSSSPGMGNGHVNGKEEVDHDATATLTKKLEQMWMQEQKQEQKHDASA
ncbi:hypothetical protein BZG36_04836 [Bifiguratus adelaidae]|uniref:C3H1-type domain-containing protein n=1 Tax=Bifiguratus adelaidae TaxID=1938954 RepID=A0A261XU87_9FUNG|nr:hypothetical protein BZG36_04836 [Bifiguratus adelaidae]